MIGNDIIDLQTAGKESNWKRKGFLEKLFTEKEKEEILGSKDPEILIWVFWSMKEAAYKANQRRFALSPSYTPKSFSCKLNLINQTLGSGEVRVNDNFYFTKTTISTAFIHSVTHASGSEGITTEIFEDPEKAKPEFIRSVSILMDVSEEQIHIKKDQNSIPHLYLQNSKSSLIFSLSHHGKFSAYACELRNI